MQVLHDVSFSVADEVVAVFGLNASGKSTLLRTVSGLTRATGGSIRFMGAEITGEPAHRVVRRGIGFMQQDNHVFPSLTVMQNLELGAYLLPRAERASEIERVLGYCPPLRQKGKTLARFLSGGERQMLALSKVLLLRPSLLLLDEPSAGLAPRVIGEIFDVVSQLRSEGVSILIAEQNVKRALEVADRAVVMVLGRSVATVNVEDASAIGELRDLMTRGAQ
jgi:branched-chain amino acid transport system ATP-binding protein